MTQINRRRALGLAAGSLAGVTLLGACGLAPSAAHSQTDTPAELYLTIVTGRMIGKKGWPAYLPTAATVPANTTVRVHITNFDDGTATLPPNSPFSRVTGALGGTATAAALTMANPNAPGPAKAYSELPRDAVAHTFTLSGLQLNVPIPVSSVVTFSFKTGKPGTYDWECMAPCGSPPEGFGGAMHAKGYMMGSLHVV